LSQFATATKSTSTGQRSSLFTILLTAGVATLTVDHIKNSSSSHGGNLHRVTQCAAPYNKNNSALAKTGGDVVMLGPTKEKATGILFPNLCNAMTFVGCGVRVKYGFVKVRQSMDVFVCLCLCVFLNVFFVVCVCIFFVQWYYFFFLDICFLNNETMHIYI
jgi:hypothetical protein